MGRVEGYLYYFFRGPILKEKESGKKSDKNKKKE